MVETLRVHPYPLRDGIRPTPEFARKKLAQFSANVGLKCGHGCTYCSSGALLRCHVGFKQAGESPFKHGYCIVDPDIPEKVARDASRRRKRGMVQLCTTVDAWCPGAQQYDLGRRCLKAILDQPGWTVRILTKNAAVVRDFDLLQEHRDRVVVGLSLTRTAACERVLSMVEPGASPSSERMAAIRLAHELGLRVYGMLCPLLPGISDTRGLSTREATKGRGRWCTSGLKEPSQKATSEESSCSCLDEPFCSRLWSKIQEWTRSATLATKGRSSRPKLVESFHCLPSR